jgi:hypothetical protein
MSILDAALACIAERISEILLQPGDKAANYIASLHNEVVSNSALHIVCCLFSSLDTACRHMDHWHSVI